MYGSWQSFHHGGTQPTYVEAIHPLIMAYLDLDAELAANLLDLIEKLAQLDRRTSLSRTRPGITSNRRSGVTVT